MFNFGAGKIKKQAEEAFKDNDTLCKEIGEMTRKTDGQETTIQPVPTNGNKPTTAEAVKSHDKAIRTLEQTKLLAGILHHTTARKKLVG